jgi:hypothetical protein
MTEVGMRTQHRVLGVAAIVVLVANALGGVARASAPRARAR